MDIAELELTVRSYNALKKAGITTVERLIELDWEDLNEITNIGEKSAAEICWECIKLLKGEMFKQISKHEYQLNLINKYYEISQIVKREAA